MIRDLRRPLFFIGILAAGLAAIADPQNQEAPPNPDGVSYFGKNIRPLLVANCYPCHSSSLAKPMSGLFLDSKMGMLRGGNSGAPAIVPGKPDDSLLISAVRREGDLKMPPGKALSSDEVAKLVEWIKMGAPDPRTASVPAASAPQPAYDWNKAKQHWSFRPVTKVEPPRVASAEWNGSPVDRFIKKALDAKGIVPSAKASRRTLIRRATLDLTGLPPTLEEVDAFLKDASPDAWNKVVDRLLASPRYGEREGRMWLDVVRYSDTAGDNSDYPIPAMYRYRNWVIDAFNRDMPYDAFIRDQIAGDIYARSGDLVKKDIEAYQANLIASSYISNSRRFGATGQDLNLVIDDTIDNIGKGILGLTTACARCHDHKFDPIPTTDYYALYGIFQSSLYPHPGSEIYKHEKNFTALNPADDERLREWEAKLNSLDSRWEAANKKIGSADPAKKAEGKAEHDDINNERIDLGVHPLDIPRAYAMREGVASNARVMIKGDPGNRGPEVPRGFLTILGGQKVPSDEKGSGRAELADWLTDAKNPLTARVMVNRIWQGHFGRGLVATPDDFGMRGDAPSNPELLDYLASCFVEHGWSVKAMHRLIMLSRAYQSGSGFSQADSDKDPSDALVWRYPRRRLDAEQFRDALLFVSGNLDLTPGGPQPFPNETSWIFTEHNAFIGSDAAFATSKRSVYMMRQRIRRNPFFELFDGADTNAETGLRPVTTTALQALYRMNDPFFNKQAEGLAARVAMARNSNLERFRLAYELVFAREPDAAEIHEDELYLSQVRQSLLSPEMTSDMTADQRAGASWISLMRVLLSSNEFLTYD